MYKDACNLKSNQRHLGTIKSSSLNMEIVEYTSPDEVAASTVASINLARMVSGGGLDVGMHADLSQPPTFDYNKLKEVTKHVTKNLNKVIDISYYPVVEATNSNVRHRPIGIGVQGLADAFSKMGHPFESASARQMNKDIFETIYFGACEASCEIAARDGPYSTYEGSPASKGELQFDLWAVAPSKRWDWSLLKEKIARHGLRNSLLTAGVSDPGAARILGCTPTTNPSTSDTCGSRDPARDLASVEAVSRPPSEISGRILVDLAADRGPYICHSQCLRIPRKEQLPLTLAALHFRAWRAGLKAGVSCTRTPSPTTPSPAAAALAREGSCTDDSLSVRAG